MRRENEISERLQLIAQKEVLSFKEALLYLDVSKSFLYKLTSRREISFSKPNNGKLYFMKSNLDDWMQKNSMESISDRENQTINFLNKGRNGK